MRVLGIIFSLTLVQTNTLKAENTNFRSQKISFAHLIGESGSEAFRLGYQPTKRRIEDAYIFGEIELALEFGVGYWRNNRAPNKEEAYVVSIVPIIAWDLINLKEKYPVKAIFGIGISVLNCDKFSGKELGSRFQFEDQIGVSLSFGERLQQTLTFKYMHYSNGGINDDNPGMDFLAVSYSYDF